MCIVKLSLIILGLLILPLVGILIEGKPVAAYLEFPPKTRYVEHASFSWLIFMAMATVVTLPIAPFLLRFIWQWRNYGRVGWCALKPAIFPTWGWIALGFNLVFWVIAWTRFACFAPVQRHTFIPLWYSFIIVANHSGGRSL